TPESSRLRFPGSTRARTFHGGSPCEIRKGGEEKLIPPTSTRAGLRLRGLEPPYDASSWPLASSDQRGRAKQSWKRIRATNRHGRRTTSRSIRPTKFNKLSGARAAAHKSTGLRPALIGRRNPVRLLLHAAEKTGKMRTPQ